MADKDGKLTHEDRVVWEKVARTVRRAPGRTGPVRFSHGEDISFAAAMTEGEGQSLAPRDPQRDPGGARQAGHVAALEAKGDAGPRLHPIERPVRRKLARGRLAIDGRIDLHGLTQGEAHLLLFDFLSRARQRGLRHVLVITGKGGSPGSEGALKRAVPHWLAKPDFRLLISGHEPAARGHGGEGALYIRLRRDREAADRENEG